MKKIILTLSGVLFVIVTGCSLLICMMNGIPNLDQPAAAFYLAKAILLSFSLPLVTLKIHLPVCSVPLPKIPISAKKIRRTCWILLTNFK